MAFLSGAFEYGVLIEKYCFYLSKCPAAFAFGSVQENCNSQLQLLQHIELKST